MPRITRRLEFDAGHRVLGHEGKCKNLHGHRYVAGITILAPELDPLGRVIDFGVVKQLIGGWIDEHWDHNLLLHQDDPLWSLDQVADLKQIVGRLPYKMPNGLNPTAETIAAVLFWQASQLLPHPLIVHCVRIYETPNCWADCYQMGLFA